ncbi:WD40 repeat domain 95, partial [Datura stramonium]|nr:WD40 repeat domain 95 [Datura stramonium]
IETPEDFLSEWWDVFYGIYNSHQAEHAQESYVEAAQTFDNVVYHIHSVVPASSPHSARP